MECAAVGAKTAVSRTLQTTSRRVAQIVQKVGGARAPAGLVGDVLQVSTRSSVQWSTARGCNNLPLTQLSTPRINVRAVPTLAGP